MIVDTTKQLDSKELQPLERLVVSAFQLGVIKHPRELYNMSVAELTSKVLAATAERQKQDTNKLSATEQAALKQG